jgi:hypothetical protein
MSLQVIEGTWDEIERHKAEFAGRQLRLIVKPPSRKSNAQGEAKGQLVNLSAKPKSAKVSTRSPRVSAMGKYAGVLSVDDFIRSKQEEIDLEDRNRR